MSKCKKVAVIFVCYLFECPIITHEPLTKLASTFDWELGRTTEMFLTWLANAWLG